MISRLFRSLARQIYNIGLFEATKVAEKTKKDNDRSLASIDATAIVDDIALYNNQNDPAKIRVGERSVIQGELLVFKHGGEISIGAHCFVGRGSKIWSSKRIAIGDRVLISHNVNIHDNNSHPIDPVLRHQDMVHIFTKGLQESIKLGEAEIVIEDDAWIGFNAIILKGVRIGKGAIIGAGAIVTKDVPDFAVVTGDAARVIRIEKS
jgi:acetyltransferase-like isoleucine patch superfamily enzyme